MESLIQNLPKEIIILLGLLLSFMTTYLTIPVIIMVVKQKKLMDTPNERSSHSNRTPTMGGIAFYSSLILLLFYISFFFSNSYISMSISAGLMLLFFIGVKDDLVALSPKVKFIAQTLAAIFLLINPSLVPYSLDGFLWINDLPHIVGFVFGGFIVLSIVNSFNLIDGINGSASIVGIVILLAFSFLFFQARDYYYGTLAFTSIGFLLAFLRYNLSTNKLIFMGDTGSLVVGFLISLFVLRFLALPDELLENMYVVPSQKLIVVLAILFIPFFDTLRVFTIRFFKDFKPFKPDRNHIHHIMIDYMHLSHTKASILLGIINLITFVIFYLLGAHLSSFGMILSFVLYMIGFSLLIFYFNRSYTTRKKKKVIRDILNKSKKL